MQEDVEFAGKVGVANMNDLEVEETMGVVLAICKPAFVEVCQMELSVNHKVRNCSKQVEILELKAFYEFRCPTACSFEENLGVKLMEIGPNMKRIALRITYGTH